MVMPHSRRWIHALVLSALLLLAVFVAVSYTRESLAVDSALDAGASYDYFTGQADFIRSHPYVPYIQRHRLLLIGAGCLFVAAVVYSLCATFFLQPRKPSNQSLQPTAGQRTES
jgi:hypothetical protein